MGKPGEREFRDWVAGNRRRLRETAYLVCGDWYLADDLVQEALTRLCSRWGQVAAKGDPLAYARRTLVNLAVDHRRSPSRREVPHGELPDAEGAEPSPGSDGDRDHLLAALRQVPARQRAVLVLRYWEDLSVDQVAQLLGITTGTVKSQANRGLATLRSALAPTAAITPKETW